MIGRRQTDEVLPQVGEDVEAKTAAILKSDLTEDDESGGVSHL